MRQYLCEGATGAYEFIVDRTKPPVQESKPDGTLVSSRVRGRLSICDCVNGNNRRYSRKVWEKNLITGSPLQESIKRNAAFGTLEHPKDGLITLLSPISHIVTEAKLIPDGNVEGEIKIIETDEGGRLRALIDAGYNPLVSSRGYGSLKKASDGVDEVEEDYVCEGFDVVIKPSFEKAELNPDRGSSAQATMAKPVRQPEETAFAESIVEAFPQESKQLPPKASPTDFHFCPKCWSADIAYGSTIHSTKGNSARVVCKDCGHTWEVTGPGGESSTGNKNKLKESTPSTGPAAPSAAASQPKRKSNIMEINEIHRRVSELKTVDVSRITPQKLAEGVPVMESLHQEVERYIVANPNDGYEGRKLHNELDSLQKNWSESASQPARRATKLAENNTKLMKIVVATAKAGNQIKSKLGESLKTITRLKKIIEDLTQRGQGWHRIAETRKAKLLTLEKQFDTSCESLDLIAARYHEDVTELGRRVIVLEFKEKAQTPEIQKLLKEATRLRHIAAIRETLEGKKPEASLTESNQRTGDGAANGAGNAAKAGNAAPAAENKSGEAGKVKPPVTESAKVLLTVPGDPRGLNESIDIVQRLSTSRAV